MNLEERIVFIQLGTTSDGYGGTIPTDTEVLTTWCNVEQLSQGSRLQDVQQQTPTAYRVTIYKRGEFTPDVSMLVSWRGRRYRIITAPETKDVRLGRILTFNISE